MIVRRVAIGLTEVLIALITIGGLAITIYNARAAGLWPW